MSCEIRHIAQLLDVQECQKRFAGQGDQNHENWLQDSLVSLSLTGETLVVAKSNYLIVFTSKWDLHEPEDVKMKYSIIWQGTPCMESGEITSVLCLPMISHGHSASNTDWTCIVVGFSSGTLKFYTEQMHQLLNEVIHAEPVLQIKLDASKALYQRIPNNTEGQSRSDSVHVLYKSVICIINGFSLFQTLRGCRNRLVRKIAAMEDNKLDCSFPIDFKKYGFTDQDGITDVSFIGQTSIDMFDHLVTASLGNFEWYCKPSPPQTSLIIATGRKPFLGFHYTVEGGNGAFLGNFALAVASKLKERAFHAAASLPGFLTFGIIPENDKTKLSQEPAEPLRCRFSLSDSRRYANKIVTSQDGKLSAISDSLGRILLIENSSGIARRLWKGYREAQCGFIEATEDLEKPVYRKSKSRSGPAPTPRRALFIVIYSPRKGLIDVYALLHGPCVASFKVSKHGRLIYTPHGLLEFNILTSVKDKMCHAPVVFLSEDGIRDIVVPFHCGLGSDDCNKAKDLHLFKKIKALLKEEHSNESKLNEEIFTFAKDLTTNEIKVKTIEMLISHRQIKVSSFTTVLNVFKERFMSEEDTSFPKNLVLLVELVEKVLAFYNILNDLSNQPPNYKTVVDIKENETTLAEILLLSNKEMDSLLKLIRMIEGMEIKTNTSARVNFAQRRENCLYKFLSCFDFQPFINMNDEKTSELYLSFNENLSDEKMNWIGKFIFGGIFYSAEWMNDWKTSMSECKLNRIELMKCLTCYWLNKNQTENLTHEVSSLVELMKTICSSEDAEKISIEYNTPSPWWQEIRNYLKSSTASVAALLAAAAFRAVTITVEQVKELKQSQSGKKPSSEPPPENTEETEEETSTQQSSSYNNDWENVSKDTVEWDLLMLKLEDLTVLNSVLKMNIKNSNSTLPKVSFESDDLSLNLVLEKGAGYISELVAKWLVQFGLDPSVLIDHNDVEFQKNKSPDGKRSKSEPVQANDTSETEQAQPVVENDTVPIILGYLKNLKQKFPYSLTTSSLLSNISWEFIAYWHKNVNDLICLEASVNYLRHIPSLDLQHGLSYLCWNTYVVHMFAPVAKLINKFGKVPKDEFCVQEVNLTNTQITVFLKNCTELLNIMLETGNSEKSALLAIQEGLWQNESVGKSPNLVALALSQSEVNEELLLLHYQLSLSLYMAAELNLTFSELFGTSFRNEPFEEFFSNLTKKCQITNYSGNKTVNKARRSFLGKAIVGAVQTIEVVEHIPAFPVSEEKDYTPETRMDVEKSTKWISFCYTLAELWNIPVDIIRKFLVLELYRSGFDRLAEEVLPAVNDPSRLGDSLMGIAGERLKIFIENSCSLTEIMSKLSPNLSIWLQNLKSRNIKNHDIKMEDLKIMLSYILQLYPAENERPTLVLAMLEAIPFLENEDCL